VIFDRYEHVGLRHNPFAVVDHQSELAEDLFVDRGLAPPPPPGSSTLVQLIGAKGMGKTTHVHHWRRAAPGPYHYVPFEPYRQRWSRPPIGPIVYADEIDRMPHLVRSNWFRRAAAARSTLVAGTHVDLELQAQRSGLAVVAHHLGPVDRETLAVMVDRRLCLAALSPDGDRFAFSAVELEQVLARSRGVLRIAEGLCHELLAEHVR